MTQNILVTGYIDLHSKENRGDSKDLNQYKKHASYLLNSKKNIYFFCESSFIDEFYKIIDFENRKFIEIIPVEFYKLINRYTYKLASLPSDRNSNKDTALYLILNHQKVKWVAEIANQFEQRCSYTWIDLGINHVVQLEKEKLSYELSRIKNIGDKIVVPRLKRYFYRNRYHDYEILNDFRKCHIAGGIFTTSFYGVSWFETKQDELINELLKTYNTISWEMAYWSILNNRHPDMFYTYFAKWNKTLLTKLP